MRILGSFAASGTLAALVACGSDGDGQASSGPGTGTTSSSAQTGSGGTGGATSTSAGETVGAPTVGSSGDASTTGVPGAATVAMDSTGSDSTTAADDGTTTSGETTVGVDSTTSDDTDTTTGVTECCDEYPAGMGCDEEDDGVSNEDSGGGSTGGAEDTGVGKGDDFPLVTSVYDMQLGLVEVGELIALHHVVVTSPTAPVPDGFGIMFTVAEPEGGPYSGITIRTSSTPVTEALQPGDVITLEGEHRLRYIFSLVGVFASDIIVNGTGAMPDPVVIPAEEIDRISAGGDLAKPLESVVVRVENPVVVDPRPCEGEVEVQEELRIDDRFLAEAGEDLPVPEDGYEAVVGPLLYTFNGFEVAPRTLADVEE